MSRWLGGLDAATLTGILIRRPESAAAPVPRNLADLAGRLSQHNHVSTAVTRLCAPAIQLLEVAQALLPPGGAAVPRTALGEMVGRDADDPELIAALEVLYQRALAWPHDDEVVLAGPLRNAFAYPLRLGRPAAALLASRPLEEVRRIGYQLGCRLAGRPRREVVDAVAARLADPEVVHGLIAAAPGDLGPLIVELAQNVAVVQGEHGYVPTELRWPIEHGLLVSDGWSLAEFPREVALALRGSQWRAPFDPHPPLPPLPVADPTAVAREAAAALGAVLDGVTAVVDAAPIALLKSGGVGVRELRRLARITGHTEAAVAVWLEIATGAGLLAEADDEVLPTAEYDGWAHDPPAARIAALVHAWTELPVRPSGGTPLRPDPVGDRPADLRGVLLDVLSELAGSLPADGDLLTRLLAWHAPLALPEDADAAARLATGLWDEMRALGVVAHGALSPLGRALVDGSDLAAAAAALVTSPTGQAVFQADLTAVVAGSPAPELARLLDSCADREARGAASVWRFSPASMRRALDGGAESGALLDRLRGVGSVPQALEYLVSDVARRHGALRVRAVGCVLRSTDPALLAEVAADRRLTALGLAALAPTVLASTRPPAETLAALRSAGYVPAGEDASGAPLVELPPQRRAERPVTVRRVRRKPSPVRPEDAAGLAARLLAAPRTAEPPPEARPPRGADGGGAGSAGGRGAGGRGAGNGGAGGSGAGGAGNGGGAGGSGAGGRAPRAERDPLTVLTGAAPQLDPDEVDLLADALAKRGAVRIIYFGTSGRQSERVIEPLEIEDGYLLRAWCQLRDDERVFALSRIHSVAAP